MLTRIEIDGFKTFSNFSADFRPFIAVVGANASGKSNLFDALRFLSRLSQGDVRQAMQDLRGEPMELFRQTPRGAQTRMRFAVEVLLPRHVEDEFGARYETPAQRIRYEIGIELRASAQGIYVFHEDCRTIKANDDKITFQTSENISRSSRKTAFLETEVDESGRPRFFRMRQDGLVGSGASKRGNPLQIPAAEATRSALSTITTAEFRHLYAVKRLISGIQFLEINPLLARKSNDRFEAKRLRSDASNLAASLSEIQRVSATTTRPHGRISDISADLSALIPQVRSVNVTDDVASREYAFEIGLRDGTSFSSRVISDGTIRLLALLTVINDPAREGVLCFEEPENGVHEGRIPDLISILRNATKEITDAGDFFQVLMNTHSPAVMKSLYSEEILFADLVLSQGADDEGVEIRTRMRGVVPSKTLFDDEHHLYPEKISELLKKKSGGI